MGGLAVSVGRDAIPACWIESSRFRRWLPILRLVVRCVDRCAGAAACQPMPDSARQLVVPRRYRVAGFVVGAGLLTFGLLLMNILTTTFRSSLFWYYGVDAREYRSLQDGGMLDLTKGQVFMSAMVLVLAIAFIGIERRRSRALAQHLSECRSFDLIHDIDRLTVRERIETLVNRGSLLSGVLLLAYILEQSYVRYADGLGWGMAYSGPGSILALASLFGLSCIVGLIVASISMVGLRALVQLQQIVGRIWARAERRERRVRAWGRSFDGGRGPRFRFGVEILSRPPPCGAVA